jgi:hypothetical protein
MDPPIDPLAQFFKVAPSQVLDQRKRGQKQVAPLAQGIGHGAKLSSNSQEA